MARILRLADQRGGGGDVSIEKVPREGDPIEQRLLQWESGLFSVWVQFLPVKEISVGFGAG